MYRKFSLIIIILVALLIPGGLFAQDKEITFEPFLSDEDRIWEGEVHINTVIRVPEGKKLIIKAGTRIYVHNVGGIQVQGTIQARGEMGKEIIFETAGEMKEKGKRFKGIILNNINSKDSYITNCIIKDALIGISCTASSPVISNNVFNNCTTAIELWQESNPKISRNLIRNCNAAIKINTKSSPLITGNYLKDIERYAIHVLQSSRPKIFNNTIHNAYVGIFSTQGVVLDITGNAISDSNTGISIFQSGEETKITSNRITNNSIGIKCDSFSKPIITQNYLEGNITGIAIIQFSSPTIKFNEITGNHQGIVIYKKCNPAIEKNNIFDNDQGIFCDFSSYPIISNNNIFDNLYSIKLGLFQSADWESKGAGSVAIMKENALKRKSRASFGSLKKASFNDFIEASGNYWGDDVTKELNEKGNDSNISAFYDYYDKKVITYEGWGDTEYKLDKVKYDNWLTEAVKDSGRDQANETKTKRLPVDISIH